jgi:hypothetical protein
MMKEGNIYIYTIDDFLDNIADVFYKRIRQKF